MPIQLSFYHVATNASDRSGYVEAGDSFFVDVNGRLQRAPLPVQLIGQVAAVPLNVAIVAESQGPGGPPIDPNAVNTTLQELMLELRIQSFYLWLVASAVGAAPDPTEVYGFVTATG